MSTKILDCTNVDEVDEENAWLRQVVASAATIIEAGAALMTDEQLAAWEGHGSVLAIANQMDLGEYHIRALDMAALHMEGGE